ncbi:MAG: 3-deoxy-8-phosphooctulonate synthase [Deltaproteobacteria bacterium]|nr:3-deoxy-8-phosphooctulonate synthase [Deltaproteobacteria bacterium]MBW1924654.1 3-deoxy-8-phosphooctulonate synthase [Deltaproteobacteria bacterium]MBW1950514.1 3-deoxy-8-phosphooctulonate synthase [Deltaproteobacteria bacterium]MBW2008513.1 3-deoxy-8-phosphooctulonate synthase [Deltaproteobacteria bacterium]MBW2103055.1 3-deoxy-8-phosphooctulonate synthase [Deltaproteobacteria bacterium]
MAKTIQVGPLRLGPGGPFFLIAGPCVIEDESITLAVARYLRETSEQLDLPIIFKASYDKANRTALSSYRGPGMAEGLAILRKVREETGLPLLSDVHRVSEVAEAAGVLDALQIPAFLCRQTDLVVAAAETGRALNIKKGQFLSPWEMKTAVEKATSAGNRNLMITERGTSFGYNNLVVDMRSIAVMKTYGFPVVFDATHSVQLPGGAGTASGGQREFAPALARAAVAAGADGVFMEVHPDPERALCDGPNSLPLEEIRPLAAMLLQIHRLVRSGGARIADQDGS